MKKFAFLLAIVALFAMSASAFADDTVELGDYLGLEAHNNPSEINTKEVYFLKGTTPSLDVALDLSIDSTDAYSKTVGDYYAAVVGGTAIKGGLVEDTETLRVSNVFQISSLYGVNYSDDIKMSFAVYSSSDAKVDGVTSVDVAFKPVSVNICLSADAQAQNVVKAYIGNELSKALSLDITKNTLATKVDTDLKLAIISTDLKTIISTDATAANTIAGLAIAKDETNESITIKGTPTAEGEYILAAYVDAEPKVGGTASVAGLTKALGGGTGDYILACTNITVEKTEADLINDAIKASAVSADLVAANGGKGGPVSLVMDAAGKIVSADLSKAPIELGKTGSLEIKIISLDLKGASSVDKVAAWGADAIAALAAVVSDDENGGKQLTTIAPTKAADGISSILTYDVNAAKLLPARAASVDVDYARTISFPTTVGAKAVKVVVTETVERGDTSSGGACDMGLGLAAAALAVVILKKRG